MAFRVLAYVTVFLGMTLCVEGYGLCLAGERLICSPDVETSQCNITDPGPLWIQTCDEHENACFNASHMYTANGNSYMNFTFGCIYIENAVYNCESGLSALRDKHPAAALGFQLLRDELSKNGVTPDNEMFQTCVCNDENCNGALEPRDVADNNNRANSIVWPIIIGSMFATLALIAIGAAVSLFA